MTQCQECGVTLNSVTTYTMPGVPILCEGCFDALADSERAAQIDAANEARAKTLKRRDPSRVHCPAVTMEQEGVWVAEVEEILMRPIHGAMILMSLLTFLGRMGEPVWCHHIGEESYLSRGIELCARCHWPLDRPGGPR